MRNRITLADYNGDGKLDIATANSAFQNAKTVSVFRNAIGENASLCANANISLISNITGSSFQWQVNTGSGFANVSNNSIYSGVNTPTLQLSEVPNSYYGYQYRCVVDGIISSISYLKFENSWTGNISSTWESTGNWSCGSLPDANTDVTISSGNVVISSNVTIRSLTVAPGATVTVQPGFTLTITH